MQLKAELLINSGSRTARLKKDTVRAALREQGVVVTHIYEITRSYSVDMALETLRKRQPKLLIIAGGDGTVSSVIDHIVGLKCELGIIPLGTTNNFARSLNIPLSIEGAVKTIISSRARSIDLGKLNDDHFTNVAGIGISAYVASTVTSAAKRRYGRVAYAIEAIRQLFTNDSFFVTIEDPDRELSLTFETRQVIIANGRYHAGRRISEDASVANNQLIIFALGGRSRFSLIWRTIDFYVGTRKSVAHASYFVGRRVSVRTSTPQPIELDGEVKLETPIVALVETAAVNVRY